MLFNANSFMKKFVWCLPVLIMTIFSVYFVNLFDRIHTRTLNRQLEEKHQIINFVKDVSAKKDLVNLVHILDRFDDTVVYAFDSNTNELVEKYHAKDCPFRFSTHPYENKTIKNKLFATNSGSFRYDFNDKPMYWDYSWLTLEGNKYLILVGITNYSRDILDRELQLSIGFLLLLTGILNWILVGYSKYLYTVRRKINRIKSMQDGQ